MNYNQIKKEIDKNYNYDKNFCTVIASSVAFELPFNLVHDFYSENGRKIGKGLPPHKTEKMIFKLSEITGYEVQIYKSFRINGFQKWSNGGQILTQLRHSLTPNNAEAYLPLGNYILGVRGHVLGVNNGTVQDWTQGKKHRIERIWKVEI